MTTFSLVEGPRGLYVEVTEAPVGLFCIDIDAALGPHLLARTAEYEVRLILTPAEASEVRRWAGDFIT